MKNDPIKKEYNIRLNHKQLRLLERSLNLLSRIGIGQLEEFTNELGTLFPKQTKNNPPWQMKENYIDAMKKDIMNLMPNESFGIGSKESAPDAQLGYEMQKIIQNALATVENHQRPSVWYNAPLKYTDEPLIRVEEIPLNQIRKEKLDAI